MLSTILATDSLAVPASQAGGKSENISTARLAARVAPVVDDLRMYFGVAFAAAAEHLLADGVELAAELLDVLRS